MKRKSVFIVLGILLLVFLILFIRSFKTQYNTFTFPDTIIVKNYTNNEKSDTMVMIILNKIMKYDTMSVNIYKLNNIFDTQDMSLNAHIIKNQYIKKEYNIFLKNDLDYKQLEITLSHELFHLKQMEDKKLVIIENGYVWNMDSVKYNKVAYEDRIYEIEALNNQNDIKNKLDALYSKIIFKSPF